VGHTEQVGVEVVEVGGLVAAGVAAPGVSLRVEPLVEEIQRLVGVDNVAVGAGVHALVEVAGGGGGDGR